MQALGMIEVIGLPPAIEAADSALKAANVTLLAIAKADAGILTVEITGDVGAVIAAVDAGAAAAERVGTLRAKHVIPHVDESLIGKVLIKGTKLFQSKKKVTIPIRQNVNSEFSNSQEDDVKKEDSAPLMDTGFETESKGSDTDNKGVGTESKGSDIENKGAGTKSKESDKGSITDGKGLVAEGQEPVDENGEHGINSEVSKVVIESSETKNEETIAQKIEPITTYTAADLKKKSNDALRAILQSQGVELTELHKSAKKQELIQFIITQQNHR